MAVFIPLPSSWDNRNRLQAPALVIAFSIAISTFNAMSFSPVWRDHAAAARSAWSVGLVLPVV